jgi:hypothetical protein
LEIVVCANLIGKRRGFALWAALLALACGNVGPNVPEGGDWDSEAPDDGSAPPDQNNPPPVSTQEPGDAPLRPQKQAELVLLDAGREPRSTRRYSHRAGQKVTLHTRVNLKIAVERGKKSIQLNVPADVDVVLETLKVDAQGNARRRRTFEQVSSSSTPASKDARYSQEDLLGALGQIAVEELVDPHGNVLEAGSEPSKLADPGLRQALDDLDDAVVNAAVAFPEAAIGTGARWQRKRRLTEESVTFDELITTTLEAVDGSRFEATVDLVQQAAPQTYELPDGSRAELQISETRSRTSVRGAFSPLGLKAVGRVQSQLLVAKGKKPVVKASLDLDLELGKQP